MKKLIPVLITLCCTSCASNYELTSFYVKNKSPKTAHFKASGVKASTMGPFEMTLPFTVNPGDSVLARKVKFLKTASPTDWFTKFSLFPIDRVKMNDPAVAENWVRSSDPNGKPVYTFNIKK